MSLTDQWNKGKLPEGWHYVKDIHNKVRLDRYFKETDNFEYLEDWEVDEVLAEVPSYEGFMALVRAYDGVVDENTKLKELLKRCKRHIKASFPEIYRELLQEISQVLGEE